VFLCVVSMFSPTILTSSAYLQKYDIQ
jgi:hypothetical protein